jgi:hypothetical protein
MIMPHMPVFPYANKKKNKEREKGHVTFPLREMASFPQV